MAASSDAAALGLAAAGAGALGFGAVDAGVGEDGLAGAAPPPHAASPSAIAVANAENLVLWKLSHRCSFTSTPAAPNGL